MDQVLSHWPALVGAIFLLFIVFIPLFYRVVVPTNMVHTVQSSKKTISYGSGQAAGNVYYRWPSWLPVIGISRIVLPVSNFDLSLNGYEAYDKDRVPFVLDVTAFFRIADTNKAAQRVSSTEELRHQLHFIVQGAVRKILASFDINQIMTDRATFGQQFTDEVKNELVNWGVEPVKNMELMDLRDANGSHVIADIMAKKSSHIAMESRIEVAKNTQAAETAEIEAQQEVDTRKQEALKRVGIATEQTNQDVLSQKALTTAKDMEVKKVETVKSAEITKEAALVEAEQQKATLKIIAEGNLDAKKLEAQGIEAEGAAKAAAEKQMQLAPVQAQIELAKEIGENVGYQQYLALIEFIKAYMAVGGAQATALQNADVKIIANSGGSPIGGMNSVMDLFTANGGANLGSMIEAFRNFPEGQKILDLFRKQEDPKPSNQPEQQQVDKAEEEKLKE